MSGIFAMVAVQHNHLPIERNSMMLSLVLLATIGLCISTYVFFLERKIRQLPEYKAVCDLSDKISCTKPAKSQYGSLFYISNGTTGIFFYLLVIIFALFEQRILLLTAAIAACIVSLFLAYLLYFKIKTVCLLCTSLYIVNVIILYLSIRSI